MHFIDQSWELPHQNIAFDEILLNACDDQEKTEVLRVWESPTPFVVLGYSNKVKSETNHGVCKQDHIPVIRRCSGGGTVVQGPGCMNYALVLDIKKRSLTNISKTNKYVMTRIANSLGDAVSDEIQISGDTDLTIQNLKFSGNAQRRRQNQLLFHGTILYDFNLELITRYLPIPLKQPQYRASRPHATFIKNISLKKEVLTKIFKKEWGANTPWKVNLGQETSNLTTARYRSAEWNFKY